MKTPQLKLLLLIAALLQVIWGLVPSASQIVISEIPVELYIALRWTISGLIFLLWILLQSKTRDLFKREALWVSLLGIGGYALASFGSLYGLKIGGVTNFALMSALYPIVTSSVAILFLRERPQRLYFLALPLCVIGLLLLIFGKHQISSVSIALSSSALIIAAAILEATVFVFSKRLNYHFGSIQYLAIAQLSAAGCMWLLQASTFSQVSALHQLSMRGWLAAIFVSVVACVLCYSVLYWLLNHLEGHRLALFEGLHTVSATLFGVLIFKEPVNGLMVFGGGLILAGLIVGNLPQLTEPPGCKIDEAG